MFIVSQRDKNNISTHCNSKSS